MDYLLIPLFLVCGTALAAVAVLLALYAIPLRAAIHIIGKNTVRSQEITVSWGIVGARFAGRESRPEVTLLLAGRCLLSVPVNGSTGRQKPAGSTPVSGRPESSGGKNEGKTAPEQEAAAAPPAAGRSPAAGGIPAFRKIAGPLASFVSLLLREFRFEEARGTIVLGLGDPALTGEVCGMYWAGRFLLEASRVHVDLRPVFDRETVEFDLTIRMRIAHPLHIITGGLRFATVPAVREILGGSRARNPGAAGA